MAIRTMTTREQYEANPANIEVVRDYHGHEEGVRHCEACPSFIREGASDRNSCVYPSTPEWESFERGPTALHAHCVPVSHAPDGSWLRAPSCSYREPLYMQTKCVGLVVGLREMNGYDDSDFYALVWNEKDQRVDEVCYASTRGWTYPNGAAIDADEATMEKARAYETEKANALGRALNAMREKERVEAERVARLRFETAQDAREMARTMKGQTVQMRKGKTVIEGVLFWVGSSGSGKTLRIGVKDKDGIAHWGDASKLQASSLVKVVA